MAKKRKDYLDDYLDYDDFDYDYKNDPVYQAMKKQYLSQAERTAEDVLGKYAIGSGGGGVSSAAISAASNAANKHKSELNAIIPELYDLAWDMYNDELENKRKKYDAVYKEEKTEENSLGEENDGVVSEDDNGNDEVSDGDGSYINPSPSQSAPVKPGAGEKSMNEGVFEMTKNLIMNMIKAGEGEKATSTYAMYKNSMSAAQRSAIEKILGK